MKKISIALLFLLMFITPSVLADISFVLNYSTNADLLNLTSNFNQSFLINETTNPSGVITFVIPINASVNTTISQNGSFVYVQCGNPSFSTTCAPVFNQGACNPTVNPSTSVNVSIPAVDNTPTTTCINKLGENQTNTILLIGGIVIAGLILAYFLFKQKPPVRQSNTTSNTQKPIDPNNKPTPIQSPRDDTELLRLKAQLDKQQEENMQLMEAMKEERKKVYGLSSKMEDIKKDYSSQLLKEKEEIKKKLDEAKSRILQRGTKQTIAKNTSSREKDLDAEIDREFADAI